jgi:hypothetical protein
MWKCEECGNENQDYYSRCGHCTVGKDGSPPLNPQAFEAATRRVAAQAPGEVSDRRIVGEQPTQSQTPKFLPESVEVNSLMSRYWDAYVVAKVAAGLGEVIKVVAVVLAALIALGALLIAGQVGGGGGVVTFFLGVIGAAFVGGQFYLLGVIVMAQGQILKASLDGAVNSSPFLQNEHRAKIMSLK